MRKKLIYLMVFASIAIVSLAFIPVAVIVWNSAPLFSQPGVMIRLKTYLTTNTAETSCHPVFPELITPQFYSSPEKLWQTLTKSIHQLNWEIAEMNEEQKEIHAIVTTPLFRFKDDILIRIEEMEDGKCGLYIRSSSRIGKGDLGKNTDHILRLNKEISSQYGL